PATARARLEPEPPVRPPGPVALPATGVPPGDRYARAALTEELARVATAPVGHRNPQLGESTPHLYHLPARAAPPQGGRAASRPPRRGVPGGAAGGPPPPPPHPGLGPPGRPGPPRP